MARDNGSQDIGSGGGGGSSSAVVSTYTCASGVVPGDAVYISAVNTVALADATDETTAPAIGIVQSKPTATSCIVVRVGECTALSGLTAGTIYYLAKGTPGGISATPPVAPAVTQKIGEAKNSTTLEVTADSDFVVIE